MSPQDAMRELTCDEVRETAGAYVLGALDAADEGALRAHLATCNLAHEEIAELGSLVPAFVEIVPVVEPPEGLKARIMSAAAADLAASAGAAGTVAAPAAAPISFPSAAERATRRARTSTGGWLLRIAAVLVIAALGGWNLLLQNQLTAAQQYEQNVAAVLDAAGRPGSLTAILTADGGTGSGLAAVDANGDVALAMRDLAPTSGNSVYETWVIGSDGVPVPVGSFQVGSTGIAYFQATGLPAADGIVLALTLEPGPGATTPTAPIISKGVAGAPG
jgi:anti-sigma factor RsiW